VSDDGFAILLTAHVIDCHTDTVLSGYTQWCEWCEAEGCDPEVMTFENWLEEMRALAEDLRDRDEEMRA